MKQLVLDISLEQRQTLDNFVVGRNAELFQLLRGMAAGDSGERFVYIWGEPGSGRTHLLKAALGALGDGVESAAYVDGAEWSDDDLALYDVVAVDNVERLSGDAQIAVFNLYNWMRDGSRRLLVAGERPPAQLALRQDLVTRLGWGLVYQVHSLTDQDKAQALNARAAARGLKLGEEVVDYLLRRWRRDMPSLLAALDALDRYSLETKRAPSVALLREILFLPQ